MANMKYLLNHISFIFLMVLFSFFDNFGTVIVKDYYLFKGVFVGDACVGKTQIFNRYFEKDFLENYMATIGVEFANKEVNFENKKIKLQLWDTAGQEKFKSIIQPYYRNSELIVFVYAINNRNSFDNIQIWVDEVKEQIDEKTKFLLVGNKCDLGEDKRLVTKEEAKEYAKKNNMEFFEVSAKEGTNINDMFNSSLLKILEDMKKEKNNNLTNKNTHNFEEKDLLDDQDIDGIKNKKNSCWSKYCSCCPCLKKSKEEED